VSDQKDGAVARGVEHVRDERLRRVRVEVRRRLVEDQYGRVREKGSCDDESLPLAAGEPPSLFPHERVQPLRKRLDPVGEPRTPQCVDELVVGCIRSAELEVLADGRSEDVRLLAGESEGTPNVLQT